MSDNAKNNVIYGDSRFDEFKNRCILEATISSLDLFLIDKFINSVVLLKPPTLLIYVFIYSS